MREDLKLRTKAIDNGFTVSDPAMWGDSLTFNKGNWHIWRIVKDHRDLAWQCAQLIDGSYCNHSPQDTLNEALDFVLEQLK